MGVLKIVVSLRWAESNGPNSYNNLVDPPGSRDPGPRIGGTDGRNT